MLPWYVSQHPELGISFIQRHHISILLDADNISDEIMLNGLISSALIFIIILIFNLRFNNGRLRVYRLSEEFFSDPTMRELDLFGCVSVIVGTGIGRTKLYVIDGNMTFQRLMDMQLIHISFFERLVGNVH